jgi:hypothetical protein
VVVGLVAFGVWPAVSQFLADEKPKPPGKVPEFAAALLSPKLPPPPKRDPFGLTTPSKPSSTGDLTRPGGGVGQLPLSGFASNQKPSGKPVDPLSGLILTGTCIMGNQRLAVINGRLYAPRETLATGRPAANKSTSAKSVADKPATSYQVLEVLPYKVLLAYDGQVLELGYSNVTSGPGPRGGGKAGAGAKRSRGGSSGKAGRSSKGGK